MRTIFGTNKLLRVAGKHRLLYLTAAYTGRLRLGELRQIVRGDLQLDHKRPHILVRAVTTKNRTEASIPLHREVVAVLNAAKPSSAADNAPVFRGARGWK